jgi:hypothetical protein
VLLVGDQQRDRAVTVLRRAYAHGYLAAPDLEHRVDVALRATTATQILGSVRGVPGGMTELALEGVAIPAVRAGTFGLRVRLARFLLRLALGAWAIATAALASAGVVWALAAGVGPGEAVALLVTWLFVTGCAYGLSRGARRLSRP